jgi:hypothetical protein
MLKLLKNKKNRMIRLGLLSVALAIFGITGGIGLAPQYVSAQETDQNTESNGDHFCQEENGRFVQQEEPCIAREIVTCQPGQADDPCSDPAVRDNCRDVSCNTLIRDYVEPGIRVLTGLMGLVVAISIVAAGIQYASSASDPGKVAAAKKRLTAAIIALISYLFMFAFLNWLLPGGVL